MADLEVHAHMKIRPGQLEGFTTQAAELIRLTKEKDTRTLRYDWYISRDGTECEVHEAYADPRGLMEHNANITAARDELFAAYADDHFMTFFGELSPDLADLVEAMHESGHLRFARYSFLEGLQPSPSV